MSNVFKNNTPELHMDELDAELEDNKRKKLEADRIHKKVDMHGKGGLYMKEEEREKHHEMAQKIEDKRLGEEMAFKAQQKQNRDFSHAERVAEKDEKLQQILNKNM